MAAAVTDPTFVSCNEVYGSDYIWLQASGNRGSAFGTLGAYSFSASVNALAFGVDAAGQNVATAVVSGTAFGHDGKPVPCTGVISVSGAEASATLKDAAGNVLASVLNEAATGGAVQFRK